MLHKQELASIVKQIEKEHSFSGAMLVSQAGEVVFEQAYGFASRQLNVPNALDTKFHIASVTKMFTAMAALILFEQGLIELDEKPAAYIPELAALDKDITLHHLLSHKSGLQDIYDVKHLRFEMHKLKHEQGNLLSYLLKLPQLFRPGEKWSYSSTGYILTGYIMERVTGLPFAELMTRLVLTPLSMTNSGLDIPRRINPGRAYGHTVYNGELVNASNDRLSMFEGLPIQPCNAATDKAIGVTHSVLPLVNADARRASSFAQQGCKEDAPGELYSTVRDLKKWCDAMYDCPLVSPQTLQRMFTPHGQVEPSLHYGYGWFLAPRFRMHGGGTPGFISRIKQYPEQKVSIILLANSDHMSLETILSAVEPFVIG